MLHRAIKKMYKDDQFWEILVNESAAKSGPFDGGCLICAKAIMLALDNAELVRITSRLNGGQTEHYGIRYKRKFYDMSGVAHSTTDWIERFKADELVYDTNLGFAVGYDPYTPTLNDAQAAKKVSKLLVKYLTS